MTANRAPQTPTERLVSALKRDTPLNVGGRAVQADSALSRTRAAARGRQGTPGRSGAVGGVQATPFPTLAAAQAALPTLPEGSFAIVIPGYVP